MVVRETKSTVGEVTAITAVCLAGVAAVANLIGALVLVRTHLRDPGLLDDSLMLFTTLAALLAAIAFGYGAVLLARRDETGRWMLIVAAGTQLVLGLFGLLATLVNFDSEYGIHWFAAEPVLRSIVVGFGGVPGAVTAIVNHSWAAGLSAVALGALVLLPAALPWTASYTAARPRPDVGTAV
ncbi:hypothetical protein [Nocardia mangyaensis]|nr:hypothetical protein [Nocardia mangyaensis]